MYPLLKIRNLTHNTFSLENEIIFYGKENDVFDLGSSYGLDKSYAFSVFKLLAKFYQASQYTSLRP